MYVAGGGWQHRQAAGRSRRGSTELTSGPISLVLYTVCVACESIGLSLNNPHQLIVHVEGPAMSTSVAEPRSEPR